MSCQEDITKKEEELSTTSDEFGNCASSQESEDGLLACSTDAVHPRMSATARQEALKKPFYCQICESDFSVLKDHYHKHISTEHCQYCNGLVYRYVIKNTQVEKIYHTCSSSSALPDIIPDANMNL
ncbi:uncharacterized protein LOC117645381 [Thrips palmi]|uniref:Uncharacterized protein LOC117645381 n=1 Tax=Thrips palmi TaxID=161013 RepID=A0A6P8YW15_THRPL|nr:uncharacterized protein LOC117645381 [Thrips palmi]XP_034241421.1 uncharacterized protein LOC117645381 [Thrips palmi]